jgi:hypothetical protein
MRQVDYPMDLSNFLGGFVDASAHEGRHGFEPTFPQGCTDWMGTPFCA